ncbi:hypothetical protein FRC07_006933 [Ceratobasidium sp. 392]|nr:hypothetical protein FRC07_006933 [Ceratobasidium sp. 392]
MRASTSFATLVALMAVAGSAAPIGADSSNRARSLVSIPSKDSSSIVAIPLCENCHDDSTKNNLKPTDDTVKAVLEVGKGSHDGVQLADVDAKVNLGGGKEQHEQPQNNCKPPQQNDQKPNPDNSDINVDVKADVKDEVKADVHANVADAVKANVSVDALKDDKSGPPAKDTNKDVHGVKDGVQDGVRDGAKDVHDISAEVKADLGKVVGNGNSHPIVSLGRRSNPQDLDYDDLTKVGGKPVVSTSLVSRFSSLVLPRGWVA